MADVLLFALLGLGAGAVHGATALGIVLVSRATGTVNLAAGVLGASGAYLYADRVHAGWPVPVALGAGTAFGALVFLLAELVVFGPIARHARDPNAPLVAGVGIVLAGQALLARAGGTTPTAVPAPVGGGGGWRIGSGVLPEARVWLVGTTLATAAFLAWWTRRTVTGRAVGVAAGHAETLAILGFPVARLQRTAWAVAGAGTTGLTIVAAPTLTPSGAALGVVAALAAALAGRLERWGIVLGAAVAIGVVQSELSWMRSQPWFPDWAKVGLAEVVPLVVIVATLWWTKPSEQPDAATVPVPRGGAWPWTPIVVTAVGLGATLLTTGRLRFAVITTMIGALLVLSYVVMSGQAGLVGLTQTAVAGVAAFSLARIGTALPFPLCAAGAVGVATVLGLAVTWPTLHRRGPTLVAASLAAAVAVEQLLLRNPVVNAAAGNRVPRPALGSLDLSARRGRDTARVEFAVLVLVVLVVICALTVRVVGTRVGRVLRAAQADEAAAASAGIDTRRWRLVATGIACAIAATTGVLTAYARGQVSPEAFGLLSAFAWVAVAQAGGVARVETALAGSLFAPAAIVPTLADQRFEVASTWSLLLGGALVTVTLVRVVGVSRPAGRRVRPPVGGRRPAG